MKILINIPQTWRVAPSYTEFSIKIDQRDSVFEVQFGATEKQGNRFVELEKNLSFQDVYYFQQVQFDNKILNYYLENNFDFSRVYDFSNGGHNRFREEWENSDLCPDSSFYVVENSDIISLTSMSVGEALQHYVLLGDETLIEIVAAGYNVLP
ncbi:hypothetical protein [Sessilibacter sp. MAH4]